MSRHSPVHELGLNCPNGGGFYICETGPRFIGCCRAEACTRGCSDGNLEAASFDPSNYGDLQDQSCPSGSLWYTCNFTSPPFMGCCKTNPCAAGACAKSELAAGFLSTNPAVAGAFLPGGDSSTETAAPSSTASAAAAEDGDSGSNTAAIAGGAAGGGVAVTLIVALLIFWWLRRRRRQRAAVPPADATSSSPYFDKQSSPGMGTISTDYAGTPVPMYNQSPQFSPPTSPYPPSYDPRTQRDTMISSAASHHSRQVSNDHPANVGLGFTSVFDNNNSGFKPGHRQNDSLTGPVEFPVDESSYRAELESNPVDSPRLS